MSQEKVWLKPRVLALGLAVALGAAGLSVARASQKLFAGNPPASLKLADSNQGPSKIGFAPVVKSVVPAVVNISSSKVVRTPNLFSGGGQMIRSSASSSVKKAEMAVSTFRVSAVNRVLDRA